MGTAPLFEPIFRYKSEYAEEPRTLQYGLIAEEVAEVYPDLVMYDPATGKPQTVHYHLVNAMLLNEGQKQQREIEGKAARIEKLERVIEAMERRLSSLEAPAKTVALK